MRRQVQIIQDSTCSRTSCTHWRVYAVQRRNTLRVKSQDEPFVVCMRTASISNTFRNWSLCGYNFLLAIKTRTYRYEWNERENTRISRVQAWTPSPEAAWANRSKTCLWEGRLATPAKAATLSEGFSFAVKPENLVREVVAGWRNKPGSTEATQSSTAARDQQTSLSKSRTNGSQAAGSQRR